MDFELFRPATTIVPPKQNPATLFTVRRISTGTDKACTASTAKTRTTRVGNNHLVHVRHKHVRQTTCRDLKNYSLMSETVGAHPIRHLTDNGTGAATDSTVNYFIIRPPARYTVQACYSVVLTERLVGTERVRVVRHIAV